MQLLQPLFIPSTFQQAIFEWIVSDQGHLVIDAVAGSGKTTTIVKAIESIKGRSKLKICFLAFNKHIVEELKGRLPKAITVATMHSLGYSCIIAHLRGYRPEVDTSGILMRDMIYRFGKEQGWFGHLFGLETYGKEEITEQKAYCETLADLLSKCKATMSLAKEEIEICAERFGYGDLEGNDFARLEKFIRLTYLEGEFEEVEKICFDDMVFLCAIGKVKLHSYDYVFVDEAQDLNRAQQRCLDLMLKENGRLVCVGDPYQAIYGFSGADYESFDNLSKRENTKRLPLSDCYRCGKEIVAMAQTIVPHIQAYKGNGKGVVRYGSYLEVSDDDLVLCRFNAPIVGLCFEYIREGKKAKIKGRDIGTMLLSLITKHKNKLRISDLMESLEKEKIRLLSSIMKTSGLEKSKAIQNSRYVSLTERVITLAVIGSQCSTGSVHELREMIENLFADEIVGITLSSIHKSKGLEAKRIFIVGDDFAPAFQAQKQWEIEQEMNLIYVSYTRAKQELIFINDYDNLLTKNEQTKIASTRFEEYLQVKGLTEGAR